MSFQRVAALDDLWSGDMSTCVVDRVSVLLVRVDDDVYAYEDRCAHLGVPLSRGRLVGCTLTCSAHEWQYDVTTGRGVNPERARLRRFPVRVEDGHVAVDVTAREDPA
jgi:toluene monooxygenase system ferredoxin subunit